MSEPIQLRSDASTNWITHNPILNLAEYGYETDTLQGKYGDGVTTWLLLPYSSYLLPKAITSNYTILRSDQYIRINSSSPITITLPAARGSGMILIIKNINTATATIAVYGSDQIDGASSISLAQYQSTRLIDGLTSNWDKL